MQQYNLLLEIPKMSKCTSEAVEHGMCMQHDPLIFEIILEEWVCLEVLSRKHRESEGYYTKNNKNVTGKNFM